MKKILSLTLAFLIFILKLPSFAEENGIFLAPPSEWAIEEVKKAEEQNITEKNKSYNYRGAIRRDDFCDLAFNLISNVFKAPIPKANNNFNDTSSVRINALFDMGIITGKADGIFAPADFLTREEAATILIRISDKFLNVYCTELYFLYDDEADISDWAKNSVQIISNMGIMKGTGDNKFSPKDIFTTQEAIITLVRMSELSDDNKPQKPGFADKLLSQMPNDKNYMLSPLSVKMALALAANGANGATKQQILDCICIDDIDCFNELSKELIKRYSQTENLKLSIANSIWINSDKTAMRFSPDYEDKAKEFYNADVKTTNNKNAVSDVNAWVNDKTNGKIPTIIDKADFWASIVNAIYFKGAWQKEFYEGATQKEGFTSADGKVSQIDFMNKLSWMPIYNSNGIAIAEIPYKNRFDNISSDGRYLGSDVYDELRVSMYLMMGEDIKNPELELNNILSSEEFKSTYTKFSMPKFKIEFETSLNEILNNLGITDAFNMEKADFKNMFDKGGNMFVSDTIHKTYISVDEKGTEAAAVTAIGMAGSALPPEPLEVKFNKPFYFIIRDKVLGETLFVGRFAYAN
jgi:serpin B